MKNKFVIGMGGGIALTCGLMVSADARRTRQRPRKPKARPENPTVTVVVPALNEAASIDWVLSHLPDLVDEVVLVDGLSIDYTEAVARKLVPGVVVVHQRQKGKGAALRAGFAAASSDIIVMIDADGSTDPREIPLFVEALKAGADFAKGSRHMEGGDSIDFTPIRRLGNLGFVTLGNLLYGTSFTDLLYGYAAFWRSDLEDLCLDADGFEIETQLCVNAVKAGMEIVEVPSIELERRAGVSNLDAWKDGRRVLKTMLKEHRLLGNPGMSAAPVQLLPVHVAAPDSAEWRPAGADRRRAGDRRQRSAAEAGYTGPERRTGIDRRRALERPTAIFVVRSPEDRRQLPAEQTGYTGPERRVRPERRTLPDPVPAAPNPVRQFDPPAEKPKLPAEILREIMPHAVPAKQLNGHVLNGRNRNGHDRNGHDRNGHDLNGHS